MTGSTAQTHLSRAMPAAIQATLDSLPRLDRAVLEALATAFFPTKRSALAQILSRAGVRNEAGRTVNSADVAGAVQRLSAAGWIEDHDVGYACVALHRDAVAWEVVRSGAIKPLVAAIRQEWRPPESEWRWWNSQDQLRDFRLDLLMGVRERIAKSLESLLVAWRGCHPDGHPYVVLFAHPRAALLNRLPATARADALRAVFDDGLVRFADRRQAFEVLRRIVEQSKDEAPELVPLLVEQLILRGRFDEATTLLAKWDAESLPGARGWLAFLQGDDNAALEHFRLALARLRQGSRAKKFCLPDLGAIFFPIALQREGTPAALAEATAFEQSLSKLRAGHPNVNALERVAKMRRARAGLSDGAAGFQKLNSLDTWNAEVDAWTSFIGQLCAYWLGVGTSEADTERRARLFDRADAAGYDWVAAELAALIDRRSARVAPTIQAKCALFARWTLRPCVDALSAKAPWLTALEGLSALVSTGPAPTDTPESELRLAWILDPWPAGFRVQPVEQKRIGRGRWSKGRPIALRRLAETPGEIPYLTDADRAACAAIKAHVYSTYGYTKTDYVIDRDAVLPLLKGHPAVFQSDNLDVPMEITVATPSIVARATPTGMLLTMTPSLDGRPVLITREGPSRLHVIRAEEVHTKIAALIGAGLEIPAAGRDEVSRTLSHLAGVVSIETDIDVGGDTLPNVEPDSTPHVQLTPSGEGLRMRVLVSPIGEGGPTFRPGAGPRALIGEREGEHVRTVRDFEMERTRATEAITACTSVDEMDEAKGEWTTATPEGSLSLLLELQDLDDNVIVEWPRGKALRAPTRAGLPQLHLSLRSTQEWFTVTGELRVDESLVVSIRDLVEAVEASPGAFVPMGEGRMLALTDELRRRIRALAGMSSFQKDALRLPGLSALVAPDLGEGLATFKTDRAWKDRVRRVSEAMELEPEVPSTLQATLRPYQVEAYRWLVRLAHTGAGACLADDMGLGKTLEALAVALTLAHTGPILVVAPTSVCFNWIAEASRFAPTLKTHAFGPGDRETMLGQAGPFDLVVCSYGLLFQEHEALKKVRWAMVVMDEAQAIKNAETKRSAAATSLDARFKLVMTGTPIENRLDELWSLFRFINPGLLGSQETFRMRFAIPIERDGRKEVARHLKRLIQPLLLRRTKAQVLEELPARTEVVRRVALSEFERATYEALRRAAVERVANLTGQPGQGQMTVLAELMKLRRACCHPRLAIPEASFMSSKLEALGEILDELRANRHKALVFSQFVDHLTIVREFVVKRGFTLQYLDGSTSPAERKRSVEAFQDGQGEVFLISLKAGGVGLNLTAADYVIHMDPWWNPAVEDQASDRAHRIGQTRPVTVYRLVAERTIEDKILAMHADKRDLAERLLEGSDRATRVSLEEMIALLREGG